MSSDGSGPLGVTNHKGQLLKGLEKECHKVVLVVDGSVVPLALGANPFATITALAERSVLCATHYPPQCRRIFYRGWAQGLRYHTPCGQYSPRRKGIYYLRRASRYQSRI